MQKLQTVNADTLLYEPLEKPSFVVDGLIPTGLTLFCGSQKIGKSWLMLKLCLCVSQGIPLWDMPTREGDVLYLCLEDTFCRIQDRLFRLTDEASGRLHFAVASDKLSDGLIVQLEDYLKEYPDSRLIVIDTLQKIRTASKDNAYASDYGDISLIKDFADRHSLAVIVVHHIRKQNDSDVFNKVSGTTGLTGSADATFVLEQENRASNAAKLYVTGRDTPYQEFKLRFRDCSWELVERKEQEQLAKEAIPDILFRLVDFMQGREGWTGTATELLDALGAGAKVSQTGKKIFISWGKIKGADGYQVYVAYCGKKFTAKPVKTVKSASVTKVSVEKINGKKLNLKKNYKVYIAAYKTVNGKKVVIGKTLVCHIVGKNNNAYTNVKQIKLAKSKFTIKKGETAKIKAKAVLVDKKKKQLSNAHAQEFRYVTSNKKVATVSKKGKIKAVGKGSCIIYVYARNGYAKKIKVKVK